MCEEMIDVTDFFLLEASRRYVIYDYIYIFIYLRYFRGMLAPTFQNALRIHETILALFGIRARSSFVCVCTGSKLDDSGWFLFVISS